MEVKFDVNSVKTCLEVKDVVSKKMSGAWSRGMSAVKRVKGCRVKGCLELKDVVS